MTLARETTDIYNYEAEFKILRGRVSQLTLLTGQLNCAVSETCTLTLFAGSCVYKVYLKDQESS